ncbi:MAG: matrixin family metalloprotease [Gemmatimonadota bacterium]|nr:matrixin family metalloprotease [Gemmatimonadota bacterium]
MARLFLWLTIGLGLALWVGRVAEGRPVVAGSTRSVPVPVEQPAIPSPAKAGLRPAEERTPLIARLAKAESRRRLVLAGSSVYLDSLFRGSDSVIRRWGEGAVVRVLIRRPPEALAVVDAVGEALRTWQDLRLGPTLVETRDSLEANLVVAWVPAWGSDSGAGRTGLADVRVDDNGEIRLVRISLARADGTGRVLGLEETRSIALHEFGHSLGLPHSGSQSDIMYPMVSVERLSDRDRSSARLLYSIPPGSLRDSLVP